MSNKLMTIKDKVGEEARGAYVYTLLSGKALEAVEHLEPQEYQKKQGEDVILRILDQRFPQKDKTAELGETLTDIFQLRAKEGEGVKAWIARATEAFEKCSRKSLVKFPEEAQGWVLLHRSGFTEEQKAVILARSLGDLKREEISKAIRSCYPEYTMNKKKPMGAAFVEKDDVTADDEVESVDDFHDIEQFLAEHQGNDNEEHEIYEEEEVAEVLAVSWKEKRVELAKLKKSRQFHSMKDTRRSFRVEIDEIKRKTRCHRCNQIGHWSRECPTKPRSEGKGFGKKGKRKPSGKTESGEAGAAYVESGGAQVHESFIAMVAAESSILEKLRQRREGERQPMMEEQLLVSSPGYGVVDSGCGRSIIGVETLKEFNRLWKSRGVEVPKPYDETNQFRYGNGHHEVSTTAADLPVTLAGKSGKIRAAIVQGKAPLLISRKALRTLKATINFTEDKMTLFDDHRVIKLQTNSAGQYTVNVMGDGENNVEEFEEVMVAETEPSSTTSSEGHPIGPPKIWSREDWGLEQTCGPSKHGPSIKHVVRRITRDADTGRIVFDDRINDSKPGLDNKSLPKHVWHTITEFYHHAPHLKPSREPDTQMCMSIQAEPLPPERSNRVREHLTKHQVRQLQSQVKACAATQSCDSRCGSKYLVAEIFSPPRFATVVEAQGYKAWSVDIKQGYDLSKSEVRKSVDEELKRNPPALLVLCPPCTNEGGWFNLNSLYMSPTERLQKTNRSRMFIRWCCRLFRTQIQLGGRAMFEHPVGSRLWTYPEAIGLSRKCHVAKLHMCMYNLRLPDSKWLIHKGTKVLVSHEDMVKIGKTCPGSKHPEHVHHDVIEGNHPKVGSISKFAGAYTKEFVRAVLETIPEYEPQTEVLVIVNDEWDVETSQEILAVQRQPRNTPSVSEMKDAIDRLHRNLGHPPNHDLVRILKHGNADEKAIALAREHQCEFCRTSAKPKTPMPAQTNRVTEFGAAVGMDVKFLPGWKPNQKITALNIVDQASRYQKIVPFFTSETSKLLRQLYLEHWVSWAGAPKELILDPKRTNLGEAMTHPTEMEGTHIRPIAAEAHWQLGRTERHGGWFETVLRKLIDQFSPQDQDQWMQCVHHAHVKNQMIQSYGYTPHQFVFGKNPHIPSDLMNEPLNVVAATASLTDESVAKSQALRTAARRAVVELQDDQSLRKALSARPRVTLPFQPGDLVAYWRQQKWSQGQLHQTGQWYGTAVVVGYVGRNIILAHRRQILRCAPEQIRYATTEERTLIGSPKVELLGVKDMLEGGTFKGQQFVDLMPGHYPTEEKPPERNDPPQEEIPDPVRAAERPAVVPENSQEVGENTERREDEATPEENIFDDEMPEVREEDKSSNPETKESSTYGPVRRRIGNKSGPLSLWRPAEMASDDFADIMREVVPRLIDEAVGSSTEASASASSSSANTGVKRPVSPTANASDSEPSTSRQRIEETTEVLSVQVVSELWDGWTKSEEPIEQLIANYLQKKTTNELHHSNNEPALQEMINDSKFTEWSTLLDKNAVKVHYGQKARKLKEQYPQRFIGSKMVITRKPLEEGNHYDPNDLQSFRVKSRWCLQGYLDPDLTEKAADGMLQSPTLSQLGRNTLMQLIASHQWDLELGDIKGAFLEAGPLPQKYRPLFAKLPAGGIPGIPADAVIEVLGNVYGQNDAPVAWYRTFDAEAQRVGWTRSKLDPCLYFLREENQGNSKLVGVMGVHVDDTAIGGNGVKYQQTVAQLKARFPYRKWRINEGEFCGASYVQDIHTKEITMNQQIFSEKLKPASVSRGAQNQQPLTEQQIRVLRAINGSLNWLASQSRPDLSTQTSFSQQAFPSPTIRHLRDANNAVRRAKQHKGLGLSFKAIPPENLTICCHSDAAFANLGAHTQAGYVLAFVDKKLQHGEESHWCPVAWRSYKLPRAVSSTLAAESQAMSTASGTAEWLTVMLNEALDGPCPARDAREHLSKRTPILATDCKSLYDHLVSPSSPTSIEDRRTSIDVIIIRESLKLTQGHIRWIPTDRMIADGLTKDQNDPVDLLRSCVRSARYQISPEETVLARQAEERAARLQKKAESNACPIPASEKS